MSFQNTCGLLNFHKASARGNVQDYVIHFYRNEVDIENIIDQIFELFQQLLHSFKDKRVRGRLVAEVAYTHMNPVNQEESERSFHFPSYSSQEILDEYDFFVSHMLKIASRMDSFHANGSNLAIKRIKHVHIQLSVI